MKRPKQKIRFHHIGIASDDITNTVNHYEKVFSTNKLGARINDPLQEVNLQFIKLGFGIDLYIEIIAPDGENSHLHNFLKSSNSGLHHIAFEVEELIPMIDHFRNEGAKLVSEPKPAVAFDGMLICFFALRDSSLMELIENPHGKDYSFENPA